MGAARVTDNSGEMQEILLRIHWQILVRGLIHNIDGGDGCRWMEVWEEESLAEKVVSSRREQIPCEEALRVRWTGFVDFTRLDPTSHDLIPAPGDCDDGECNTSYQVGRCKVSKATLATMEVPQQQNCSESAGNVDAQKDPRKRKNLSIALL